MKVFILIFVTVLAISNTFAQDDLRERAGADPLDCALYLQSFDRTNVDAQRLMQVLFEVGRYGDAMRAIETEENAYERFELLTWIGTKFIESHNIKLADEALTLAFETLKKEDDYSNRSIPRFGSSMAHLNRESEVLEILNNPDFDEKARLILSVADQYAKLGKKPDSVRWIKKVDALDISKVEFPDLLQITTLYRKLGFTLDALSVLETIEDRSKELSDDVDRRRLFVQTIPAYVRLGEGKKAADLWTKYGDMDDFNDLLNYTSALAEVGNKKDSTSYFKQLENNKEGLNRDGYRLVDAYLTLKNFADANRIALSMSKEVDNYYQQTALMKIADYLIGSGKKAQALETLEFAFGRAKQIVYKHHPEDSIGASSGSRKGQYLSAISKRLIELRLYDRAFTVAMAIEADHDRARESLAESLVSFAKLQARKLPKAEIYKRLAEAKSLVKDSDYPSIETKVASAEVYAILNENGKAVDLLAEAISDSVESRYEKDFLISTGKIFDTYNLSANEKMKAALKEVIESHDPN